MEELRLRPIGWVSSPFRERAEAPRQPRAAAEARATITLRADLRDAVADLETWRYLWVIFWFHRNQGWRPKVRPPRSTSRRKRGVLATRSPHRPNPLGLSVVRLERVDGLELHIAEVDLLDGTPVLDIKPYVAWSDAIVDAGGGWLEERPPDPAPSWAVVWGREAEAARRWLEERGVDLGARAERALALGPQPHAYRRIREDGDAQVLAVKEWRVRFVADPAERRIQILSVRSGYRPRAIHQGEAPAIHRAFVERFGL